MVHDIDINLVRRYDPNGRPPRGEICIRGPLLFKEYYKDDKKTKEAMGESATPFNACPASSGYQDLAPGSESACLHSSLPCIWHVVKVWCPVNPMMSYARQ